MNYKICLKITLFLGLFSLFLNLSLTTPAQIQAHSVGDGTIIHMDEDGFTPEEIEVSQGETVIFENTGTVGRWPASNIHPTHRGYPGSDIEKCGTPQEEKLFDSCGEIPPGETFKFQFEELGEWRYHDHIDATLKGTITVTNESGKATSDTKTEKNNNWWQRLVLSVRSKLGKLFPQWFAQDDPIEAARKAELAPYEANYDESIAEDSATLFQDESALFSYVKKYGAKAAVLRLNELSNQFGSCHNPAHDAGRFAYLLSGGQAFQSCSAECHSGCYHGATEMYFRDHGVSNLVEDLNLLCNEDLNGFFSHQCVHGIGHGLMAYNNYEVHDALKQCDLLPRDQASCYSGVFMENVVGGLAPEEGHQSEYLSDDPHFPCTVVEEKYKSACYFYQTSQMIRLFPGNFAKVAAACGEIDEIYQPACFGSMGRDVGGVNRNNPAGAIEDCGTAPKGESREWCLSGAVQDSFWDPGGKEVALKFCRLVEEPAEKEICYSTIFGRATQVLSEEQFEEFCKKAESGFMDKCMGIGTNTYAE